MKKQKKWKIIKQNTICIVNRGWQQLCVDDFIDFNKDCGLSLWPVTKSNNVIQYSN